MINELVQQLDKVKLDLGWPLKMNHWPNDEYIQKLLFLYVPECGLWDRTNDDQIDERELGMEIRLPME